MLTDPQAAFELNVSKLRLEEEWGGGAAGVSQHKSQTLCMPIGKCESSLHCVSSSVVVQAVMKEDTSTSPIQWLCDS